MTAMHAGHDLSGLDRPAARPSGSGSRAIALAVASLGLAGVLAVAWTWDRGAPVEVSWLAPRAPDAAGSGVMAAGWVEPEPYPTRVAALVPGIVSEVLVTDGDAVRAGQLLARLDTGEAALDLAAAAAALQAAVAAETGAGAAVATAEAEVEVQLRLARVGQSGTRQVELAQARLDEARASRARHAAEADRSRAEHARAELRLQRCEVRAPVDGVLLEWLAPAGTAVDTAAASHLGTLYDPGSLRVRVDVLQADIARVRPGAPCGLESEARPGRPWQGEVLRILPAADAQKVTVPVHVRILDPQGLYPEMLVRARIADGPGAAGPAGSALQVPARLLVEGPSGSVGLWVLDGPLARLRAVRPGARVGDQVEVLEGLSPSDRLVDEGREHLTEGCRVEARAGG